MGKPSTIQFRGATGTVTGSCSLVQHNGHHVMVDCGLFQGPRSIRALNWKNFPDAEKVDAVVLTHAHIDHSGFLPRLVKDGFRGPIYCSFATFRLCEILLPDAAKLQMEDALFANKSKHSAHNPALPLFDVDDVAKTLRQFKVIEPNEWHEIFPHVALQLTRSGHILGSSFVQLKLNNHDFSKLVSFSGDIGHDRSHIIKGPVQLKESDVLIMESTYGDRRQSRESPLKALSHIVNKVIDRGGTLIVPSFAVGRTQELIFLMNQLEEEGLVPQVPIYVDSPMALDATDLYMSFAQDLKPDFTSANNTTPLHTSDYRAVNSADESMMLCLSQEPKIVISAAGMLSGGRVLHHLKQKLPDAKNGVLFVGYQATGTKGLLLKNGLPEISIHHELISVEAEMFVVDGLSAHGDCEDIMDWLDGFDQLPKTIYLNHGEPNASHSLRYLIRSHYDCDVVIPSMNEKFNL